MSVLVEMKVAGWSWALLPKAPHSFWSYQQKSLLFQQWFPWQCSQSRKGKKKVSDILSASYIGKKCFLARRIHGAHPLQKWQLLNTEQAFLAGEEALPDDATLRHPARWGRNLKAEAGAQGALHSSKLARGRQTGPRTAASATLLPHALREGSKLAVCHRRFHYQYFI